MRSAIKVAMQIAAALPLGAQMYDTGGAAPELGTAVAGSGFTRSGSEITQSATGAAAFTTSYYWTKAGGGGFTRAAGLAFIGDMKAGSNGNPLFGWLKSTVIGGGNVIEAWNAGSINNSYTAFNVASTPVGLPSRTKVQVASILLATGAITTLNGYVQWLFDDDATVTVYPVLTHSGAGNPSASYSDLAVVDLTQHEAKWGALSTLCDAYAATPSVGATYTHSRDAFIKWTMTGQTGVTQSIKFRVMDANNYWVIELAQGAPGSITLYEVVAGVKSAAKAALSTTIANGTAYKISIQLNGRSVRAWINYTTAFRFDAMRTSLDGTGLILSHAGANLAVLPAYLPLPTAVRRERISVLAVGDSTELGTGDSVAGENGGWVPDMIDAIGSRLIFEITPRAGVSGRTTATWNSNVSGGVPPTYVEQALANSNIKPTFIFIKHSVNDLTGAVPGTIPAQATFEADFGGMLDAAHDHAPSASLVVARKVWKASGTYPTLGDGFTNFATLNGYADNVCAGRAYVIRGADYTVLIKGADNGLSETADGIHPVAVTYTAIGLANKGYVGY